MVNYPPLIYFQSDSSYGAGLTKTVMVTVKTGAVHNIHIYLLNNGESDKFKGIVTSVYVLKAQTEVEALFFLNLGTRWLALCSARYNTEEVTHVTH